MREKDQVPTVATLEARSANEAIVDPMVGSAGVYVWREYGVRFCVGSFGGNLARVSVKVLNLLNIKPFKEML